jgi:hypothetical protein
VVFALRILSGLNKIKISIHFFFLAMLMTADASLVLCAVHPSTFSWIDDGLKKNVSRDVALKKMILLEPPQATQDNTSESAKQVRESTGR